MPEIPGLRFQAVHSDDAAEAYRRAVHSDVRGAFNIAADPVLDPPVLADALGARRVPVPAAAARALVNLTWRARLQPTPAGWLDMALAVPLMDITRAREELGWQPRHSASDALLELLDGLRRSAGLDTPPLAPRCRRPLPAARAPGRQRSRSALTPSLFGRGVSSAAGPIRTRVDDTA